MYMLNLSGQLREATFFSRSSNSERSTLDLSSSRTRFMRCRFSSILSVFFPTCSYMPSNLFCIPGTASITGLNSALMASMSTPTSVGLNLSSFLRCFFIRNIIMETEFLVKHIFSENGTKCCKNYGLGVVFQHRAMNFNIGPIRNCISNGVNIGTTAPARKLDINGSSIIYDQTATTGTSNLTIRAGAGQATGPGEKLEVSGNIKLTGRIRQGNGAAGRGRRRDNEYL